MLKQSGAVPCCCRIVRNILADKPRVTKFPIEFDGPAEGEALPVAGDMSEAQQQQVGTRACNRPFSFIRIRQHSDWFERLLSCWRRWYIPTRLLAAAGEVLYVLWSTALLPCSRQACPQRRPSAAVAAATSTSSSSTNSLRAAVAAAATAACSSGTNSTLQRRCQLGGQFCNVFCSAAGRRSHPSIHRAGVLRAAVRGDVSSCCCCRTSQMMQCKTRRRRRCGLRWGSRWL